MPTAREILRRYEELKDRRGTSEAHWQEIADYGLGRRNFTTTNFTPGYKRQGGRIYDNTFMRAGEMLSAGLHSLMSNPATKWFRLRFQDDRLMEVEELALWLSLAEQQTYVAFSRPDAGFDMAQHEAYTDIVNFGTGGVFMEEDSRIGTVFMSSPLSGLYVAENEQQRLDTFMWLRRLTARQVVMAYGRGASERATKALDAGRFEEEVEVLRAIMPREDPQAGRLDARGMPWASYTVLKEEAKMIREGGYWQCPMAVARWNKDAGEIYGRGPGVMAQPSCRVVNEQKKTVLKASHKLVDPPIVIPSDNVIQALQTQPGGVSVAQSAYMQSGKPPIYPLVSGANVPIGVEMVDRERADIRSSFHWELLQLIQHTPGTTPPSATQVAEIAANQQRVISPILGRIQTELLSPEVRRVFDVELRNGRFPRIPAQLAGQAIRVEYVSPSARAQRMHDAQAIRRTLVSVAELSQFDPSASLTLKADEAVRLIADAEGVPPELLRSRGEVEALLEAQRELASQKMALEEAERIAAAAGKAAPALREIQGGRAA